jgi:hypothetical protein
MQQLRLNELYVHIVHALACIPYYISNNNYCKAVQAEKEGKVEKVKEIKRKQIAIKKYGVCSIFLRVDRSINEMHMPRALFPKKSLTKSMCLFVSDIFLFTVFYAIDQIL